MSPKSLKPPKITKSQKSPKGPNNPSTKPGRPVSVGDLVGALDKRAPFDLAESWDNVGFLAGDASEIATNAIVAVNLGPEALDAAANCGANVVVCHHPPIFKPISRLTRSSSPYLYEALRRGMSVIALHTNYDLSSEGASREIAAKLGFSFSDFLTGRSGSKEETPPRSLRMGKFVTYVPNDALERVREAVCLAGAGRIGEYSSCSFSWEGEGTFLGAAGTRPTVGRSERLEKVTERRFEVVFPWARRDDVIKAARSAHPYEEMAFDVLELAQSARNVGYGFIASTTQKNGDLPFHKLIENAKETFKLRSVTVVGPGLDNPHLELGRIAFSPGSGSSFVSAAAKGADAYVCGEIGYHQMLEARQKGLSLVLLGHSYSERFFVETVSSWCESVGVPARKIFETVHGTI